MLSSRCATLDVPGIGSITGNERLGHQATREPAVVAAPHHLPVINTPYAWLWPWRWDVDQRGQTTIPALRSASLEELNLSPQQQRQGCRKKQAVRAVNRLAAWRTCHSHCLGR
jgi:hypothetical protein